MPFIRTQSFDPALPASSSCVCVLFFSVLLLRHLLIDLRLVLDALCAVRILERGERLVERGEGRRHRGDDHRLGATAQTLLTGAGA